METKPWSHLTGRSFYHLTVIYPDGDALGNGGQVWRCFCTCGKFVSVAETDLKSGGVSSCGCLPPINKHSRQMKGVKVTHGMSLTPEYRSWAGIKQRCFNKNDRSYKDYGGRGITMCDRWAKSFECFYADMGRKPEPRMSIDRINNDGNYEPGNCRWATPKQQYHNRRKLNGDT